jgi:Fe-S-cluster containining protein
MPRLKRNILLFIAALAAAPALAPAQARPMTKVDPIIDRPMETDPALPDQQGAKVYNPRLLELWSWALGGKVNDDARRAADAITVAHQGGMTRCVAFAGEVGGDCACAIHEDRPGACRRFQEGSILCQAAREAAGLPV